MKQTISTFLLVTMFALFAPDMPTTSAASMPVESADSAITDLYAFDESILLAEPVLAATSAIAAKPCRRGTFRVRRNTSKGKKIAHSLIAGGIGAAIGGGIGGGRGALIGLGSGAGGYLVYRYVKDNRGRCVARYVRG